MYIIIKALKTRINILAIAAVFLLFLINGGTATAILAVSALMHETAHFLALKLSKAPIQRLDIEFLNARIIYDGSALTPKKEIAVSLSGPIASLMLFACGMIYTVVCTQSFRSMFFCAVNLALAAVNMLPLQSTDGGNALFYCLLSLTEPQTAERVSALVSKIAFGVLALPLAFLILRTDFNISLTLTLCFCTVFTYINAKSTK